jgi:exonuclease-1
MGIPGLLPALAAFTNPHASIRDYRGHAIAIDTSSWMHKAVYSVADAYVEADEAGRVEAATVRVATRYMLARCQELLANAGVSRIYLVLDGAHRCPLKGVTHEDRQRRRADSLRQARQAPNRQAAYDKYKSCIHISTPFSVAVMNQIRRDPLCSRKGKIIIVQSPHEADAQLVQLAVEGTVQAIITEDSDVLVYAATAHSPVTILYKFHRQTGACHAIRMDWLWDASSTTLTLPNPAGGKSKQKVPKHQSLWSSLQARERHQAGAGRRLFVQACVLTGCDYAPNSLPGVGLVKAFTLITQAAVQPADQRFAAVVRGRLTPPSAVDTYLEQLQAAEQVFYYHPVVRGRSTLGLASQTYDDLAWFTWKMPEAPAFPIDNLGILGNPDDLKALLLVEQTTSSRSRAPERSPPTVAVTTVDPTLPQPSLQSLRKPSPAPVVQRDNPYRKRPPLLTSSSPNQKKKQPRTTLNPFARFCHPEKENQRRDVRFVKPSFDQKTGKRLPLPPVPKRRTYDSKPCAIPAAVSQSQPLPEEDVDTDATDTSSVSSPPSTKAAKSSYFGGRKFVRKVTAEDLDDDDDDVITTPHTVVAGERSLPIVVDEAVGVPLVAAQATAPVPPEDFYDEWLSPHKPALEDIDDSPPASQPVASTRTTNPGVVRYSLGGSKRTFSSKSKSLLTKKSYQRKPVRQPPRPGTLFDHFRLVKRSTKS